MAEEENEQSEKQEETVQEAAAKEPEAETEATAEAEPPVAEAEPAAEAETEAPAAEAESEPEPEEPTEAVAEVAEPVEASAAAPEAPAAKPKKKRLPRSERPKRSKPKREKPKQRKPIVRLPKPEHARGRRQERQGTVVSDATDKTIVVRVDTVKVHPRYKKVIRRSTRLHAHDESNEAKVGDVVLVVETRPLSKLKRWRLQKVLEAAK